MNEHLQLQKDTASSRTTRSRLGVFSIVNAYVDASDKSSIQHMPSRKFLRAFTESKFRRGH